MIFAIDDDQSSQVYCDNCTEALVKKPDDGVWGCQKIVNIFTFSLHNFISLAFYFLNKIFTSKSIFPHKKNIFIFFIRSKKGQKPPLNVSRITKRKKYIKIYFFSLIRDASCVFIPQNKKYKY